MDQEVTDLKKFISTIIDLGEEEWTLLLPLLSKQTLKKNEFFVRAGEKREVVAYIRRGLIRKFYIEASGEEITNGFAWEGQLAAPYESLLSGEATHSSLIAIEDCSLITLDYQAFSQLAQERMLLKELALKIAERVIVAKEKRQLSLLSSTPTQRYQAFVSENLSISKRISKKHIASFIGITPETLSRIIRKSLNA
jgi:CRP-like cAMP-binding protein